MTLTLTWHAWTASRVGLKTRQSAGTQGERGQAGGCAGRLLQRPLSRCQHGLGRRGAWRA